MVIEAFESIPEKLSFDRDWNWRLKALFPYMVPVT
jgi:hypothetical protein